MKKFNLMQIVPSLQSGGVEQGTIDVANYLASLKIQNNISSNGGKMVSYLDNKFVRHNLIPVNSKNFFLMPFVANKINRIINKESINILHFRSRAPAWLLPYINKKNLKTVSTFHNIYGNENIFKKFYNKQLSRVNEIIAISDYVKKEIIKIYNIKPEKITVINRGIDTNFFDSTNYNENLYRNFLKEKKIDTNKKIILFPGRLTNWKGQLEFLKIIEYFQNDPIIIYFAGDNKNSSYFKRLKNEIKIKNIDEKCMFLGNLSKEELKIMYLLSDLVISAPLKPEGFGRIISEALAMKKIVLAYNFGGAQDQLNNLDDLLKIKPYDEVEMINKIKIVLNLEKNHKKDMLDKFRDHVINNFSKERMLNSYLNFYQGL